MCSRAGVAEDLRGGRLHLERVLPWPAMPWCAPDRAGREAARSPRPAAHRALGHLLEADGQHAVVPARPGRTGDGAS